MGEARIFGLVVLEQRRAFEEIFGESALTAAMKLLPGDAREELEALSALSWCRNATVIAFIEALAGAVSMRPETLTIDLVQASLERAFRGPWKALLRFTEDDALVRRASIFYTKMVDVGELSAVKTGEGRVELLLNGRDGLVELDRIALGAGIQTVLTLAGRVVDDVQWEESAQGETRYFVTFHSPD